MVVALSPRLTLGVIVANKQRQIVEACMDAETIVCLTVQLRSLNKSESIGGALGQVGLSVLQAKPDSGVSGDTLDEKRFGVLSEVAAV
jgi:hypothetical protein